LGSEEGRLTPDVLRAPISNPFRWAPGGRSHGRNLGARRSPPQPQLGDQGPIALDILALEIAQQPAPLAHQLEQSAPRVLIVLVVFQVVGEMVDPLREDGDLNFRRPGVLLAASVVGDYLCFRCRCQSVNLLCGSAPVPVAGRTPALSHREYTESIIRLNHPLSNDPLPRALHPLPPLGRGVPNQAQPWLRMRSDRSSA
jgi:hypothetical protein